MTKRKLLANRIITPDGTMLQSYYRHDCVTYTDANGIEYMVDGGLDYQRCTINDEFPHTDASVYTDDPHYLIREAFCWGSYGKNGDQPLKWLPLNTMTDEHIQAILDTQHHIPKYIRKVFEDEQTYREFYNIKVTDE